MRYTPEKYYKAIELRNMGKKVKEIAEELGVSYNTLREWFYHNKKPRGAEQREVKRYKTRYDAEVYYKIIKLWNQGWKLKEIKDKYQEIPIRTIKNWIQGVRKPKGARKMQIRRKKKFYKYDKEEIIKEIASGKPTREIAEKYNVTTDVIYNLKKKYGLIISHSKNHYDFKFSEKLSEKFKAYIIGLIDDFGVHIYSNYYELILTTSHITYIGLIRHVFSKFKYYIRPNRRIRKYRGNKRETFEFEVRIIMPPYDYLKKDKRRRFWIEWAIKNYFQEFLAGLVDADGSIMITKKGEYILMVTNSKRDLINKIKMNLRKMGLNPLIKYDKRSRCYKVQIRRKNEIKYMLEKLRLKHPEKVFIRHLVLSNKIDIKKKYNIYIRYRKHIKQVSQKWIEREYGLSLLRYFPPPSFYITT